jgi:hypothetical protein
MQKKLFILCLIIISASGISAKKTDNGSIVSEKKETIQNAKNSAAETSVILKDCSLEVKKADEKGSFKWKDANTLCESYGEGWRLPTKDELKCLYTNKDIAGGFLRDWYWSSEKVGQFNIWVQSFSNGKQFGYSNSNSAKVRCVRSIKK